MERVHRELFIVMISNALTIKKFQFEYTYISYYPYYAQIGQP